MNTKLDLSKSNALNESQISLVTKKEKKLSPQISLEDYVDMSKENFVLEAELSINAGPCPLNFLKGLQSVKPCHGV